MGSAALLLLPAMARAGAPVGGVDVVARFAEAEKQHRVGVARKTKLIDARPARTGEIVVTVIKGEGIETRSKQAEAGDWVVRNRCPETGNEEYLVKAAKFSALYAEQGPGAGGGGWREFRPRGPEVRYFIVRDEDGEFSFTAPWGEEMVAKSGDAIVQSPGDGRDIYRVAAKSFACTYEIVPRPQR